jgi:aminopeptidase-like protein
MNINNVNAAMALDSIGHEIHKIIAELYPICRSITGDGLRETLRLINRHIHLSINEIPTGTEVFDWVIPKEWNIKDAYVKDSKGNRVVDFCKSNLHVVNYSTPIKRNMPLKELKEYLFTLPEYPDWIPYQNSYYKESWGFCLSHRQLMELKDNVYEVCIDSSLEDGSLTYGECYIAGEREDEVLVSCNVCHPSLCNDNLSGTAIAVFLARYCSAVARKYSYRFLFLPTTIGSIAWLALNEAKLPKIKHGLVLACLGDSGSSTYKKSRRGEAEIDKVVSLVLKHSGQSYEIMDFSPDGYDERQFCSLGFNLPVGCLMRTPHGRFPQYHTSADNIDFVQPTSLADSFAKCVKIFEVLENNDCYVNQNPKGEPQLGKRGLYRSAVRQHESPIDQLAILWVLNLSDGNHSLLDIAERSDMSFDSIKKAADALLAHGLLMERPKENLTRED